MDNNMYFQQVRIIFLLNIFLVLALSSCISKNYSESLNQQKFLKEKKNYSFQAKEYVSAAAAICQSGDCVKPKEAFMYLNEALVLEPEYPQALIQRGFVFIELGLLDDAFEDFTQAIRFLPVAETYTAREKYMILAGNYFGAEKDLNRALTLDPYYQEALQLRLDVLSKLTR